MTYDSMRLAFNTAASMSGHTPGVPTRGVNADESEQDDFYSTVDSTISGQ